jgi:hypothetical protein
VVTLVFAAGGAGCLMGPSRAGLAPLAAEAAVHIPEPLVFDLVRGLGAKKGELEFNTLTTVAFDSADPVAPLLAPEVEYAVADGLAFKFELPFEEGGLAAVRLAGQWTFGARPEAGFIHGTQLLVERLMDHDGWDLSLLYIPGWRFDRTWSMLTMFGATSRLGAEVENDVGAPANVAVFADLSERLVLGLEVDSVLHSEEGASLLLMPQIHYDISEHFGIQFGIGAMYFDGQALGPGLVPPHEEAHGWFAQASLRAILEY